MYAGGVTERSKILRRFLKDAGIFILGVSRGFHEFQIRAIHGLENKRGSTSRAEGGPSRILKKAG